ncbi:class I SAM-dependent methyltransferase [Liquorilactobacillus oeni]|uniref:16S RNA methylase n=1 Tax=Liquorilactobacillus oeni DSM 19972 TaxID=1423777 RepID=A0A0R1M9Z4_9LACO|nr:class I SAM-dependent methyltransferase [Liquorilactobacillus oeni]KRL04870.1 16S RNA methylase [Liquorilactobacillus oeni DSM 19972]
MVNYYYSKNPEVKHQEKNWNFELLGKQLFFITDNGVFSKKTVDFGSRVLLENIPFSDLLQGPVLDVGCGYGPLGLAIAKKFPQKKVDMVDVNELALELAQKNALLNKVSNVKIWESNLYSNVAEKNYALILSNPPIRAGKRVVHEVLSDAFAHLMPGGKLIIVIQKKQGAPSARKKMEEIYGNNRVVGRNKGYFVLESTKINP